MGIISDIFGGVKVGSSVYEGAEETNLFSGLMDALISMANTIDGNAYKKAVKEKNAGTKKELGGIVSADYEANKGPLTYTASADYQSAAADATDAVNVTTGVNSETASKNLASGVQLVGGDLKRLSNSVKNTTKNLSSLEGVDMAREGFEFTKDSSNASIGQSFTLGYLGGMSKQMTTNYNKTGSAFDTQVMQGGELGTIPMFGSGGFTPYGSKTPSPTNKSKRTLT